MNSPLVSIIVPCYNQAQYLDEALQSVLDQTYKNWECIIVNDGSPDHTAAIAQKWEAKDSRFKYLFQENGGVSKARNIGISSSTGELILPLDADDKIGNSYLAKSVMEFSYNRDVKLVYCKAEKFDGQIGPWVLKPFSLKNLALDNVIFCSAFFRKSDWESIGGYDANMIVGLEDWEFWISLLKNGGEVKCIDEVGFFYRIKRRSRQSDLNVESKKQLFDYLSVKHADFFVKQLGSFMHLDSVIKNTKSEFQNKLQSEKFVIDLFCSTFFKFNIFGKYKRT